LEGSGTWIVENAIKLAVTPFCVAQEHICVELVAISTIDFFFGGGEGMALLPSLQIDIGCW